MFCSDHTHWFDCFQTTIMLHSLTPSRLISAIYIFGQFQLSLSHSFFPSKCPTFPPLQDFDWDAFALDTWSKTFHSLWDQERALHMLMLYSVTTFWINIILSIWIRTTHATHTTQCNSSNSWNSTINAVHATKRHSPKTTSLLAPTGALVVMMVYYISAAAAAATFSDFEHLCLSILLQVSLYVA